MTFVLTNDDGIDAPGLQALLQAIDGKGIVVAPLHHHSGCSHQVTTTRSIPVHKRNEFRYAVDGTPADCTRLALSQLVPDVSYVLSGINAGGNLGSDTYISGTVAAVREAAMLGIPGIAVSHYIKRGLAIDWDMAAKQAARVFDKLLPQSIEPGSFWNVNFPHLAPGSPEPEIVFCPLCRQPLPVAYERDGDNFRYSGEYSQRKRDPQSDVDVCFSGSIAITLIRL
ncbi:5'/3'-nucleotidase SurE [Microcoleus sp. FACHB-1515]|uniref:5'/3'-nucleotidase SurE n=1 Tax=Cyanophyceae TaxID=3028117 RepID=UPI00168A2073|nr:5'/3'-nucleotidase SurE [Microcoleus sp. FACHB-1515]MBD2091640.1 5'/3'-nucleotidase SurE [Microcoleus sp. FACHB-1515]